MKTRGSTLSALALALLFAAPLSADTLSLKQQAKNAYEIKRYGEAFALAGKATEANPNDAEAWYLRGWYGHYRCWDTRPLSGYSRATSDSILIFLERAVQLDPKLGDAYDFIGVEYGMRTDLALMHGDAGQARSELMAARTRNAYPDWALEYCRDLLKCCAQNAVLFLDHDFTINGVNYLQLVDGYRRDVTAMYAWNWPGLALLFKKGIPGAITPAPISLTRDQILGRQSFPWNSDTVRIPVEPEVLKELGLTAQDSNSESEMELPITGPFMNAYTALLIDIIETNRWRRPVYTNTPLLPSLDGCLQDCGLVSRLLPVNTAKHGLGLDTTAIKRVLLDSANYRYLATVREHDMPRASGILFAYRVGLVNLAMLYDSLGRHAERNAVLDRMAALIPESLVPSPPQTAQFIEQLRKKE
jgi:tetratricopeptide (TPR) repeat protein